MTKYSLVRDAVRHLEADDLQRELEQVRVRDVLVREELPAVQHQQQQEM